MKTAVTILLVVLSMAAVGVLFAADPVVRVNFDSLKWDCKTEDLGFCEATVMGDKTKKELYIVLVKFPPSGLMSKPHFHAETRYGTVIKGTWWTGDGDVFDPSKTVALKPGSVMKHPAGAHHFDGSKNEEVIVQLMGMGPTSTTKVKPNEGLFAPSLPGQQIKK